MGYCHFNKEERLKLRKSIGTLFSQGKVLRVYPFNVFYHVAPVTSPSHKALFTISRRNMRKAVDRNTVKRRSREAYRLNKHELKSSLKLWIGFVYTPKEILAYSCINQAVLKSIQKLNEASEKIITNAHKG